MTAVQVIQPYTSTEPTRAEWTLALTDESAVFSVAVYPRRVLGDCLCMDVGPVSGAVVRGVVLALGVDLLAPYRAAYDVPQGTLWVARTDGGTTDPTGEDFARGRAVMYYLPPEAV